MSSNEDHKYQDIEGFIPLTLSNQHSLWTFDGKRDVNEFYLSLRVNILAGGFGSILMQHHEVLTLARGLTKVLKANMKNTLKPEEFSLPFDICKRANKSFTIKCVSPYRSIYLNLNGTAQVYIDISLEKAQLLRMHCIAFLSQSQPLLPVDFLAKELLLSITI